MVRRSGRESAEGFAVTVIVTVTAIWRGFVQGEAVGEWVMLLLKGRAGMGLHVECDSIDLYYDYVGELINKVYITGTVLRTAVE